MVEGGGGAPSPQPGMPRREKALIIVAVVVSLLVVASCFLIPYIFNKDEKGTSTTRSQPASKEYSAEEDWLKSNKSFNDALDVAMDDYVERPDEDYLIAAAARGISRLQEEGAADDVLTERAITTMLDALDDPFSGYMDQEQVRSLDTQLSGHFFGIGISMSEVRNEIRVNEVLKGTPAEAAGVQQGDIVVTVDGKDISGMNINDVVAMIRGQEGTVVKVGFKRSGVPGIIEYSLTRAEIKLPVITTDMLPGDIGHIILTDWTQDSSNLLKGALEDLKNQGAKGLILDLRGNPGGLMDPAIKSADLFLGGGTIVTSKGRMAGTTVPYTATAGTDWDLPVVILTNRGTASSSEIFTAALHDNDRAVLVGETTFGKGEIQQLKRQADGSALKITVALYYTPDGTSINDEGIIPDVIVTNPATGKEDLQLAEAQRVVTAIMQGQAWK